MTDKKRKNEEWDPPELRDPFDGPMSENAYPEDRRINIDGREIKMNDIARRYNEDHGFVDHAASQPYRGPAISLEELSVRNPDGTQPFWPVAHIVHRDDPIAAVLWWDDDPQQGTIIDDDGTVLGEEDPVDPAWMYWIVGEYNVGTIEPEERTPVVKMLEGALSPDNALSAVMLDLEGREAPTSTYAESEEALTALWVMPE